jgi:hypothetical protein
LRRRIEDGEHLIAPQLDHTPGPSLDGVSGQFGEPRRQARGGRVAMLAREPRIAANVREQEGAFDYSGATGAAAVWS